MALLMNNCAIGISAKADKVYLRIVNVSFNSFNTQVLIDVQQFLNEDARRANKRKEEALYLFNLGKTDKQTEKEWKLIEEEAKNLPVVNPVQTFQIGCRASEMDLTGIDLRNPESMLSVAYKYIKEKHGPEFYNYKDI